MKKAIYTLMILSALAGTTAKAGIEIRGGAYVVDVNGSKELFDLVTKSACDWTTGSSMIEANPYFKEILAKLSALDWYFANEIKNETRFLSFCLTGALSKIELPKAGDSPVVPGQGGFRLEQGAVRMNDQVYWDQERANSLSPRSRAFLLLHEVMHSYLSMKLAPADRYMKLVGIVRTIAKVDEGAILDRESLHFQMKQNSIDFPTTVGALEGFETQIKFLTADRAEQMGMVIDAAAPEALIANADMIPLNALTEVDANAVKAAQTSLETAITNALVRGNVEVFTSMLQKPYVTTNPAVLALTVMEQLSVQKKAILFNSKAFEGSVSEILSSIAGASVTQGEYRLFAADELVALSATAVTVKPTPVTSLIPLKAGSNLPKKLEALAEICAKLVTDSSMQNLDSNIAENAAFYNALGLKSQIAAVKSMTSFVPREKALAISVLTDVRDGMIQALMSRIKRELSSSQYEEFKNRVHFERFKN